MNKKYIAITLICTAISIISGIIASLKNFRVCAGLMKKFVVCVCVVKCWETRKFYTRNLYEENGYLC